MNTVNTVEFKAPTYKEIQAAEALAHELRAQFIRNSAIAAAHSVKSAFHKLTHRAAGHKHA